MHAALTHAPKTINALGYLLYDKCQRKFADIVSLEFLKSRTPEQLTRLPLNQAARFHVYYKDATANKWTGVPQNFLNFEDTLPYLQNGIRVLVEYKK